MPVLRKITLAKNGDDRLTEVIDMLERDHQSPYGYYWKMPRFFSSDHAISEYNVGELVKVISDQIAREGYELEIIDGPASSISLREAGREDFMLYPLGEDFSSALKDRLKGSGRYVS